MVRRAIALVGLLVLSGCATVPTAYEQAGMAYGVTEGPFRGRWWNYYERGRSFLDGGYYAEAKQDLSQALKERDRDQRWARTYGLHFTPQYFPNREYGITLYHLQDFAGAIDALERSYAQQPSARAACYLRFARESMSLEDSVAPVVEFTYPEVTALRSIDLDLRATDNTYISAIVVDGRPVDVGAPSPSLQRSTSIPVQGGHNTITVRVTDVAGNVAEQVLAIEGDFEGPVVSFAGPVLLPGTVEGMITDPAGLQDLTIAGVAAVLEQDGEHAARFRVHLGREQLGASPHFEARDALGNTTGGKVPVDALQVAERPVGLIPASAPTVVRLSRNLTALYLGNQLAAVAQLPEADGLPTVRFANLKNGQRYLMDEIVADLEVSADAGIKSLSLNEIPVSLNPEHTRQRVSRRVVLPKEGPMEIVAVVEDGKGVRQEARVMVERVLTDVEALSNRLSLAMLGNIWEGPNRDVEAEERFVSDELARLLYDQHRFDLVTREQLPQILTEQELAAALGGRHGVSPLKELVPSELMLVGMVRRDAETIEIILQAISPETSQLMGYVDVAGIARTKDDLRALVADLALRLYQEFPRVQGQVVDTRGGTSVYSNLALADRVRPRMKCVVFRHGPPVVDPVTGTELGRPTDIVAEGWFDDVTDSLSSITIGTQDSPGTPGIEVQDFVITK